MTHCHFEIAFAYSVQHIRNILGRTLVSDGERATWGVFKCLKELMKNVGLEYIVRLDDSLCPLNGFVDTVSLIIL